MAGGHPCSGHGHRDAARADRELASGARITPPVARPATPVSAKICGVAERRRDVYRNVRRSLERDAVLANAAERLAAAVEEYLAGGNHEKLEAALARYRAAAAQAPGPTST